MSSGRAPGIAPERPPAGVSPLLLEIRARLLEVDPERRGIARGIVDDIDRALAAAAEQGAASRSEPPRAEPIPGSERGVRLEEDIVAVVSHDLRSPLHTVQFSADMLLRAAPPDDRSRPRLVAIARAAERMRRLVDDLLDLSILVAGRLSLVPAPESTRALLEEAVESQQARAAEKSLSLRHDLGAEPPGVVCDRERVLQVLSNLIDNAIKHTGPGGSVTLSAVARPTVVELSVRDTGAGIPEAEAERVFERYWQAARTAQRGVGLGLAIAKAIVEAHGGRIAVASRPAEGSTFSFTLPRG